MRAFTPGPWYATEPNAFGTIHIRAGAPPPAPIAEVLHFGPDGAGANARLIAAAPDLLACLLRCREALASLPIDSLGDGVAVVSHPTTGETAEMRWPLRDELIAEISRVCGGVAQDTPPIEVAHGRAKP